MKVAALVSGGKDSCYAMYECLKYGHEIVCIAHLNAHSSINPNMEIDSYMYQSVGSNIVPLIALNYTECIPGDEVEDLYALLRQVQLKFPQVQGVCSGAILSTYQRNRIENVCLRLSLTSFAYLWQREQSSLLHDMITSKFEAVVVKVAAMGLKPSLHLGRTIEQLENDFQALHEKYQLNVCGEGGEYETITLDCPLFKKRIVIDSCRTIVHSDDFCAPVAYWILDSFHLEKKRNLGLPCYPASCVEVGLEGEADRFRDKRRKETSELERSACRALFPAVRAYRSHLCISGLQSTELKDCVMVQMENIFQQLKEILTNVNCVVGDIFFVHLYVRDMRDFETLNKAYCEFFGTQSPPSRTCVEVCGLESECVLDCMIMKYAGRAKLDLEDKVLKVLHVQSISNWAPCCIGPYSQANMMYKCVIYLAGQIGLVPATMVLVEGDYHRHLRQCFANVKAVLSCTESALQCTASLIVYFAPQKDSLNSVPDINSIQSEWKDSISGNKSPLHSQKIPPILLITVSDLPRSSPVEVELMAFTQCVFNKFQPQMSIVQTHMKECTLVNQVCRIKHDFCTILSHAAVSDGSIGNDTINFSELCRELVAGIFEHLNSSAIHLNCVLHMRVFYVRARISSRIDLASALHDAISTANDSSIPAVTFVPVLGIQNGGILAIQTTAHDLDQLETKLWLSHGS